MPKKEFQKGAHVIVKSSKKDEPSFSGGATVVSSSRADRYDGGGEDSTLLEKNALFLNVRPDGASEQGSLISVYAGRVALG